MNDMEVLGKGEYGVVYISKDGKRAIKEYKTADSPHEADIAQIMANMGVGPQIYSIVENGQKTRITMERLNGTATGEKLTEAELTQINELKRKMRAAGFNHGDLHLDNMMFKKQSNGTRIFYLIDFGKSRRRSGDYNSPVENAQMRHKAAKQRTGRLANAGGTARSLF